MRLEFEYGHGMMAADLPENTDVFVPGETVLDPAYIPLDDVEEATRRSIRNPIDMEPLTKLAKAGDKIAIVFPDRVKGGEQPTSHRKLAIKVVLEELALVGIEDKDIMLICSNGLHSKNTEKEILGVLGKELYERFMYNGQIINHDSEDYDNLVDLGRTRRGDPVWINKYVYDADVAILIGHTQGNPYGGYSGGYKHCSTGINHWTSIASHHVPSVMHRTDFVPVSANSLMRTKFDEIGMHMEEKMGKRFFCCDAVLDTYSRQIEINSGYAATIQPISWKSADKRTYVHWAKKKYDIMIFGMPQFFHYGNGMGTNPIMFMQAISAQVIRHKRIMNDNCVIICSSACDGFFNEELWPYLGELYDIYGDKNTLVDVNKFGEYFATNEEYIRQYRFTNAFHPFHGFSMMSCAHIAQMNTSAIYIVGASKPGIARHMGCQTRESFEEAIEDAKRIVGSNPNILALPKTFKSAAVHLCMANQPDITIDAPNVSHPCGC